MANQAIVTALKNYVDECRSQAEAARRIGLSEATISTYLKGTYKGNVEKIESKFAEMLSNVAAAKNLRSSLTVGYVPTSISNAVYKTIRLCHLKGGLAIECGDAGIGKTMAAKKYAEDYPSSSIYISVNPCVSSVAAFLKLLCIKLNVQTGRKDDMWLRLCERLSGERKVLIIDEAQHLPIKTLEAIRAFFDTYPEIGVCLVGNIETYTNTGRSKEAFAQIKNRTKLTEVRHTNQITKQDIELLFAPLQGKTQEVNFMLSVAKSEQGIRGAQNIYSNAVDNNNITYAGLIEIAKRMHILRGGLISA